MSLFFMIPAISGFLIFSIESKLLYDVEKETVSLLFDIYLF